MGGLSTKAGGFSNSVDQCYWKNLLIAVFCFASVFAFILKSLGFIKLVGVFRYRV